MGSILKLLIKLGRNSNISEDNGDSEVVALLNQQTIERLASNISTLIMGAADLLVDANPYPPAVLSSIDNLMQLQSIIEKERSTPYYNSALSHAKEWMSNIEVDDNLRSIRDSCFKDFCNTESLDLGAIQIKALDRYFYRFEDHWETTISALKRRSAVINRREYLDELIPKLKSALNQRGILKYDQLLSNYKEFNYSELRLIKQ